MKNSDRFSSKDLTQFDRHSIAKELFTVKRKDGDELHGLCPFHDDSEPSFSYNTKKDLFNCFSCDASGDLIKLWSHVNGYKDAKSGYKAFCEAYQDPASRKRTSKPTKKPTRQPAKSTIINQADWDAIPALPKNWRDRCREKFGWSDEIIDRHDIRLYTRIPTGKQAEKRIAIPIHDDNGQLRNIRLYKPGVKKFKVISWETGLGSSRLFPTPSLWGSDPVILCEGEKDALCALSHGLNAVTQTAGVKTWKAEFNKHFADRDVIICYDSDEPGQKYAEKRARELAAVAKSVRVIDWPMYMPLTKDHGQDLTDFFVTHGKTLADFQDLLADAISYEKPAQIEDGNGYSRFFGGKNGRRFLPALLAQAIMDDMEVISDPETEILYRWNGQYWEPYKLSYIRAAALRMLGDEGSSARAADAANMVRDLSTLRHGRKMNDQPGWICLKNGMFNVYTGELAPFRKDYYATYQVGVDYNPANPQPCEEWLTFLIEAVCDYDVIREIQKFFGYCLTRETRYEKALILIGPGGDGKSKLLDILQYLVGEENCANISMGAMEDQFYRSRLVDKLVNVSTEVESKAFSSDIFKAIVSGDKIGASFKHQTPFDFRPFCKLAFSSNKHPRILDNSDGFFRKILVVEMKQQFYKSGKADLFLIEKLKAELSGIFAWALEGLELLRQEGFGNPEAVAEAIQDYKRSNNPVQCFVEDGIETKEEAMIVKSAVYDAYRSYCKRFGYRPLGQVHFGRELNNLVSGLKSGRWSSGARKPCYIGISLVDDDSPDSHPSFGGSLSRGEGETG